MRAIIFNLVERSGSFHWLWSFFLNETTINRWAMACGTARGRSSSSSCVAYFPFFSPLFFPFYTHTHTHTHTHTYILMNLSSGERKILWKCHPTREEYTRPLDSLSRFSWILSRFHRHTNINSQTQLLLLLICVLFFSLLRSISAMLCHLN